MSESLELSELAGKLNLEVSAADDAGSIASRIFESVKPLELSENETRLIHDNRGLKIDAIADKGLSPVVVDKLRSSFCSDDLSLSASPEIFDLVLSLVSDVLEQRIMNLNENSGPQVELNQPERAYCSMSELAGKLNPV